MGQYFSLKPLDVNRLVFSTIFKFVPYFERTALEVASDFNVPVFRHIPHLINVSINLIKSLNKT